MILLHFSGKRISRLVENKIIFTGACTMCLNFYAFELNGHVDKTVYQNTLTDCLIVIVEII